MTGSDIGCRVISTEECSGAPTTSLAGTTSTLAPTPRERWSGLRALHQPAWPDRGQVDRVREVLESAPGLVAPEEIDGLRRSLSAVAFGRGFVVQAGDCAETFDDLGTEGVDRRLELFDEAQAILGARLRCPIVSIGRIAGQFSKPRSSDVELVDGTHIPSFFGHLVNAPDPDAAARVPDAERMLVAHRHAARTIDLLADRGSGAVDLRGRNGRLWTSHEALVLDYETASIREQDGSWYLTSAHLPWIGERTRAVEGAHVALLAAVANPVACKLGPTVEPAELVELCARLDPDRQPGRLTLIVRMGAREVAARLPGLVRVVARAGHPVIWMCDPMHGNTVKAGGVKTRHLADICAEIAGFVGAVRSAGGRPGGLHLEWTPEMVTECVGGASGVRVTHLGDNYASACDPRLNHSQALEVVTFTAGILESAGVHGEVG